MEKSTKIKLMELLFAQPVTAYQKNGLLRAAVIGEGEIALEALAALFNLGQCAQIRDGKIVYMEMEIHLYTPKGKRLAARLVEKMPGLKDYPEYAKITCLPLKEYYDNKIYDYVLDVRQGFLANGLAADDDAISRLDLININQKYANLLAKGGCESFADAKVKRDEEALSNRYNYESSFACSAHMPVRLSLFEDTENNGSLASPEAEAELTRVLNLPDKEKEADIRYKALVALEHRRWNAYMIADGWRTATEKELAQHAFKEWPDHKDKKNKIHPCIVDGGEDPFYLKNHPEAWEDDAALMNPEISELDKLSLRFYRICKKRTKERKEEILDRIDKLAVLHKALGKYCAVARRFLLDDTCREDFLYKQSKSEALTVSNGAYKEEILALDELLAVVRARNAKKDFALLDTNIINALAFDLWHGRRYQTVITACSDNTVRDVTLPFLLSADKAIYLIDMQEEAGSVKKKKIERFYKDRNLGTPEFIDVNLSDMNAIEETISNLLPVPATKLQKDSLVLNCSPEMPAAASVVFGSNAGWLNNLALLRGDGAVITDLRGKSRISCGLRRCITVKEYLDLLATEYMNVYDEQLSFEDYCAVQDIFREYGQTVRIDDKAINIWSSALIEFKNACRGKPARVYFGSKQLRRAKAEDVQDNSPDTGKINRLIISPESYKAFKVEKFLNELKDNRIIERYEGDPTNEGMEVIAPDDSVRQIIRCISNISLENRANQKEIWLNKDTKEKDKLIQCIDVKTEKASLFSENDTESVRNTKL